MPQNYIKPKVFDCNTEVIQFGPGNKYGKIEKLIQQNKKVGFTKTFGTALAFYSWLKKRALNKYSIKDYRSERLFRQKFRELTSNILIKVIEGKVELKGAPHIPWLKEFFPGKECFYISFPEFLGMNGAWQWFSKGMRFPGLPYRLHPFYGTYFPTRTEHLELFDEWLNKNNRRFGKAIDVGTGCGVLVFYMLKHKITDISATDINPNAIYSLKNDLEKHDLIQNVQLRQGNFFAGFDKKFDLVTFNPPWIPGKPKSAIDRAIYYENGMWCDFFNETANHMSAGSKLVLLFSNFPLVEGICNIHPIQKQMESDNRFRVSNIVTKQKKSDNSLNNKSLSEETEAKSKEIIELWDIEFTGK